MLVVRPVEHADVTQCVRIRVDTLGSLVIGRPPPYPGFLEDQEATIHRDIDTSPHVHHLKVVDPDDEYEVMAYAKWEVYEKGRPDLEDLRKPMEESAKAVDQFGRLREVAHDYFCTRNGEKGKYPHLRESISTLTHERLEAHSKEQSLGSARDSTTAQATRRWQHVGPMGNGTFRDNWSSVLCAGL